MKTNLILIFIALIFEGLPAQKKAKDVVIPWENGQTSLLSELGPVYIIMKKGNDIKKARIMELDLIKGSLVFEKDGALHDLLLLKIERIDAGKNSKNSMYFDRDFQPLIRPAEYIDYSRQLFSDFKVSTTPEKKLTPDSEIITSQIIPAEIKTASNENTQVIKRGNNIKIILNN